MGSGLLARAGVRVDTWVESGTEVTPFYDSLIGKLMVHGASRDDAIERMVAALAGTVLGGIPSNLEYCGAIVGSPGFRKGVRPLPRPKQREESVPAVHSCVPASRQRCRTGACAAAEMPCSRGLQPHVGSM